MLPTVYIETSVVSYLTALPSRDVVVAAYQQVTREWWRTARTRFELVASELVIREAAAGDADAAQGCRRCCPYCHGSYERRRLSGNVEFPAHRQRRLASQD